MRRTYSPVSLAPLVHCNRSLMICHADNTPAPGIHRCRFGSVCHRISYTHCWIRRKWEGIKKQIIDLINKLYLNITETLLFLRNSILIHQVIWHTPSWHTIIKHRLWQNVKSYANPLTTSTSNRYGVKIQLHQALTNIFLSLINNYPVGFRWSRVSLFTSMYTAFLQPRPQTAQYSRDIEWNSKKKKEREKLPWP